MYRRTNNRKSRLALLAFSLVLASLVGACGSSGSGSGSQSGGQTQQSPFEVDIKLSEGEAKEHVIQFVRKERDGIVTIPRASYQELETVKVPCSQIDVDTDPNQGDDFLARCQPVGGAPGAPYGYKKEQRWTRKCCRPVQFPLPDGGRWIVQYVEAEDLWEVILESTVEEIIQQAIWIVQDNTGQVTEAEQ